MEFCLVNTIITKVLILQQEVQKKYIDSNIDSLFNMIRSNV